jgi:hypothetical protein
VKSRGKESPGTGVLGCRNARLDDMCHPPESKPADQKYSDVKSDQGSIQPAYRAMITDKMVVRLSCETIPNQPTRQRK